VIVAAEVARALRAPLGVAVVRKLGAPAREEFALGAIAEDVRVVDTAAVRAARISPEQLARVEHSEQSELRRRSALFGETVHDLAGRVALVVDDGVATGATATAACSMLRAHGASTIVLAVPVAPAEWHPPPDEVDIFICPNRVDHLWSVGRFYTDFTQTTDSEVIALLRQLG
jgi:putative phosphoribosyl transferase